MPTKLAPVQSFWRVHVCEMFLLRMLGYLTWKKARSHDKNVWWWTMPATEFVGRLGLVNREFYEHIHGAASKTSGVWDYIWLTLWGKPEPMIDYSIIKPVVGDVVHVLCGKYQGRDGAIIRVSKTERIRLRFFDDNSEMPSCTLRRKQVQTVDKTPRYRDQVMKEFILESLRQICSRYERTINLIWNAFEMEVRMTRFAHFTEPELLRDIEGIEGKIFRSAAAALTHRTLMPCFTNETNMNGRLEHTLGYLTKAEEMSSLFRNLKDSYNSKKKQHERDRPRFSELMRRITKYRNEHRKLDLYLSFVKGIHLDEEKAFAATLPDPRTDALRVFQDMPSMAKAFDSTQMKFFIAEYKLSKEAIFTSVLPTTLLLTKVKSQAFCAHWKTYHPASNTFTKPCSIFPGDEGVIVGSDRATNRPHNLRIKVMFKDIYGSMGVTDISVYDTETETDVLLAIKLFPDQYDESFHKDVSDLCEIFPNKTRADVQFAFCKLERHKVKTAVFLSHETRKCDCCIHMNPC